MTPQELYKILKTPQRNRGFYFNQDQETVMTLLAGLLKNKDRYGYAVCPCRLATRDRERDKQIVCPCIFRDLDVKQYGRCYCGLYVSEDAHRDPSLAAEEVPERWIR